jgi:hypothetical protein
VKHLLAATISAVALAVALPAAANTCSPEPYNLTNGQAADAC